jgi:Fe-S cluster assembly ATP-binding protein
MIKITNLHASVDGNPILKGINLSVKAGEIHAIMGPNGSGKSTLAKIIAGHPHYEVTAGSIEFIHNQKTINLLDLEPNERAKAGIFLGFQYPVELPGIPNSTFLREAFNEVCLAQGADTMDPYDFEIFLKEKIKLLEMPESFIHRPVNEGFSGGEKKKNEILQMAVLNPRLALLDETDSGLDIDALKIVAKGVNTLRNRFNAVVLVTHYQRLLDYIVPDFVHVMANGQIIKTGPKELALELEAKGYDWLLPVSETDSSSGLGMNS